MQYHKEVIVPESVNEDPKTLLSVKLKELNKAITAEDRKAYMEESGISQGNLSLYMNGTIYDLDKAVEMAEFFKNRIEERNNRIKNAIS